jgi:hypothetical protein
VLARTRSTDGACTSALCLCAQKYTIRDLTTGKLFVLDSAASDPGSAAVDADSSCAGADAGPAAAAPGSPALARQVTDVQSGRGMTLDEFDQALGLHSALKVCTSGLPIRSRW